MDATDGRTYVALGKLLTQQRRSEEARSVYEEGCTATAGSNAHVWQAWATLEARCGNASKARKVRLNATMSPQSLKPCSLQRQTGMVERMPIPYFAIGCVMQDGETILYSDPISATCWHSVHGKLHAGAADEGSRCVAHAAI